MTINWDAAFVAGLPNLARVQAQILEAINRHRNREYRSKTLLPSVNIAEVALVTNRTGRRLAPWLASAARNANAATVPIAELLVLRSRISSQLIAAKVAPSARISGLSTYLVVHPCPSVASLSAFCEISDQSARIWLKRASSVQLLCRHETANEIFFVNPAVLALLTNIEANRIIQQFDMLTRNSDWIRRSLHLINF